MIEIIFSDMDGTLLTDENKLPEGFDEMMSELKKRGVIFSPSSGRQYFSLIKSFSKYVDDFIFLSDNGTLATYQGKEIFSQPMNFEDALNILKVGEPIEKTMSVFCGKKNAYILESQNIPEYLNEVKIYFTQTVVVKNWREVDDEPIKVSFFDPTGNATKKLYPHFEKFSDDHKVVLASDYWTDVTAPDASKGTAVKNVQKILNIKPENCAAFGDYMNDYEMLQAVDYSFAMANAHPDLKKVAKFETVDNNHFGVIVGIKKLIAEGLI